MSKTWRAAPAEQYAPASFLIFIAAPLLLSMPWWMWLVLGFVAVLVWRLYVTSL